MASLARYGQHMKSKHVNVKTTFQTTSTHCSIARVSRGDATTGHTHYPLSFAAEKAWKCEHLDREGSTKRQL